MPDVLEVTATTEDGVAMAIEHKTLPVGGVQFHPELLMSLGGEVGLRIVENAFRLDGAKPTSEAVIARACPEVIQRMHCRIDAMRRFARNDEGKARQSKEIDDLRR